MAEATFVEFQAGPEGNHVILWDKAWVARIPAASKMGSEIIGSGRVADVPRQVAAFVERLATLPRRIDTQVAASWLINAGCHERTEAMREAGTMWCAEIDGVPIATNLAVHAGALAQIHGDTHVFVQAADFGLRLPGVVIYGTGWLLAVAPLAEGGTDA